MGWWFSIAAELYTRGEDLPEEWKYSPGAAGKPVDPDDYHAPMIAGASTKNLFEFVKTVEEDAKRLKAKGKDY